MFLKSEETPDLVWGETKSIAQVACGLAGQCITLQKPSISLRATGLGLPKTAACNNTQKHAETPKQYAEMPKQKHPKQKHAGGYTERDVKPEIDLTEPQGKLKICNGGRIYGKGRQT